MEETVIFKSTRNSRSRVQFLYFMILCLHFFFLSLLYRIKKPRLTEENWNSLYVVILFLFSCTFISHVKNIFSYLNSEVPSFSQENETLKFFLISLFHSISFSIPVLSYFLKSCAFADSFTYFFSIR